MGGVARQAVLARLHELVDLRAPAARPDILQTQGNALFAAKLGDTVFAANAAEYDPDLVLSLQVPTRSTADVLHHCFRRSLGAILH